MSVLKRWWQALINKLFSAAEKRVERALDEAQVGAQGQPVAAVRERLEAALKKNKVTMSDEILDRWAGQLSRGERPSGRLEDLAEAAGAEPDDLQSLRRLRGADEPVGHPNLPTEDAQ